MVNISVGMGEIQVSRAQGATLIAPGIGSCIALTMYDPITKIGGMAHIVLPDSSISNKTAIPGKYADTAVPELIAKMIELGAKKQNLIVKTSGGSQMFNLEKGSNILNIGLRNVIAVKTALTKEGLNIKSTDTGGNKGRTIRLDVSTGTVLVKILGQNEVEL